MKTKLWKRVLSLVLVIVMVVPTVLNLMPEMVQPVEAAANWIDNGTMAPNYAGNGLLVNGIYEIFVPGTSLALGVSGSTVQLVQESGDWQRWIIEYGGSVTLNGTTSHWYTVRNVANGGMLSQDGNSNIYSGKSSVSPASEDDRYSKWRLLYNEESGKYSIFSWGQHYYVDNGVGSYVEWNGYITPVSAAYGSALKATYDETSWDIKLVPIQKYVDSSSSSYPYRLEQGTYRVTNGDYYWDAISDAPIDAAVSGLGVSSTKETDGTQVYQVDWSSDGYITVFDSKTGRYVGDRVGYTAVYDGAIAELGDDPGNRFDDRLRFYWTVIPVYTDGERQTGSFYLCNVLTRRCMYLNGTEVMTHDTSRTPWTFTALTAKEVYTENPEQGYNGDTGVYLDSIDQSNTIKLPIKIYDYVNDGMLFEYAQYVGTSETETIGDKLYRLGNNRAYSFQAGSNGGTWTGISSGYKTSGNEADAWNTYKTFTLGKVWAQFSGGSDWYTVDGSPNTSVNTGSRNEYNWEAYGLSAFRGFPNQVLDPDSASVYYMYGYLGDPYQGIGSGKTTYNGSGTVTNTFEPTLYQSVRMSIWNANGYLPTSGYTYSLYGYISGHTTIGMVQPTLRTVTKADGTTYRIPEYRDIVVEYLADLLSKSLAILQTNTVDGTVEYAYNYVAGATHERYQRADGYQRDFATWLRARCGISSGNIKIGSYDDTLTKADQLIGTWDECKDNIQTLCDAAYFMLNNLFVSGSYNEEQDMFDYLELTGVKVDDSEGNIVDAYVFDSGFTTGGTTAKGSSSAVYYDTEEKTIRNTAVTGKASAFIDSGTPVCAHPFLPIWNSDFDMETQTGTQNATESPYLRDDGVTGDADDTATYYNRNYNYVLASNGEFQYSYDDELFFNFEGDDDVYLFINGQLVLDIGGAHAITGFEINLNDYVDAARAAVAAGTATERDKALALAEGGIYSFDFYYMERHGWGSNMRIVTNIRVVEKGMLVDKDGAQFGIDLETNAIVDPNAPVEYTFSLTNSGTEDLIWPTFVDSNIGVTISYQDGLVVTSATNGVTVMDQNGGELDVTDLVVTYTNPKTGNTSTRTFADNESLIAYLTNELIIETQEKATPPFGKISIGGIFYMLTDEQKQQGVFRNTVEVTAHVRNEAASQKPVNGVVMGSSLKGLDATITGDSIDGPVNGSVTMKNEETTNRILPYINYENQVYINPDVGLYVFENANAVDKNGETLDVTDLIFTYTDPKGNVTVSQFTSNEELMEYLQTLVIEPGGSLTVDGVYFDPPVVEKPQEITDFTSGITVPDLGIAITPENGLQIGDHSNAVDKNGETLDVTDLTFTYTDSEGNTETKTFTTNEELKAYLEELQDSEGGTLTVEGIYSKPPVGQSVVINTIERNDSSSVSSSNASTGDELEDSADFTVFVPNEPKYYHWRDHEMVISKQVLTEDIMDLIENENNPLSTMFKPVVQSIDSVVLADDQGSPIQSSEVWVDSGYDVHVKYQTTGTKLIYLNIGYTYKSNSTTKTSSATIPVQIFVVDTQSYVYVLDYGLRVDLTYDQLFGQDVLTVPDRETKFEIYGVDNDRHSPVYANNNVQNFIRFINTVTNEPAWGWASSGDIDGSVNINSTNQGDSIYLTYTPQNFMDGRDYVYVGIRVSEEEYDTTQDDFNVTDIRNEAEIFKTITFMPANVVYYEDNFPAVNVNTTVMNRFKLENSSDQSYIFPIFTDEDKGVTVSYLTGLTVSGSSPAVDKDGGTLEVSDLSIQYKNASGTTEKKTFATNEELIAYLSELVIEPGASLNIAGIYYKMTKTESEDGFNNEVATQVSVKDSSTESNVALGEPVSGTVSTTTNAVFQRSEEADQAQSSDQDVQYGYDDVYANSSDVTMSGGTIATVVIGERRDDGTVSSTGAAFSFKGTGFEFISRGNAIDSAIVEVMVTDEAGNVKYYPVATKFDQQLNGEGGTEQVYQIPVFRLEGLPYGEYDVVIRGVPSISGLLKDENGNYLRDENGRLLYDYKTSYLYIDGIRIYNPLGEDPVSEYGEEDGAVFSELRTLVFDDKAAVISLVTDTQTGEPVLSGTFGHCSFTENLYAGEDKNWFATNAGGLDQFIIAGPNNEVYVDGNSNIYAVVLYVKETQTGTRGLLNIGVHDLHDDDYYGSGTVNSSSSISYWMNSGKWRTPIEVGKSGTEQYYAIDYRSCPTVERADGTYYSVVIQVRTGMVSFTNVKTVGLSFAALGSLSAGVHYKYDENGVLCQGTLDENGEITNLTPVTHTFVDKENGGTETQVYNVIMEDLFSLRRALLTTATADSPEIELPEIPEDQPGEENQPEDQPGGDDTPDEDQPGTDNGDTPEAERPSEEIPENGDYGWWEYLLDLLMGLFHFFEI